MPLTFDQLREEVLALPADQREKLIASVSEELHSDWAEELKCRSAEYKAGRMGGISLEEWERELDEPIHP